MSATTTNLVAEEGATFVHQFTGSVDWTGGTAKLQVRKGPGETVLVEITEASGLTLGDGTIDATISAAQVWTEDGAALVSTAVYRYDLVVLLGGVTTRTDEGTMTVKPAITAPSPT